MGTLLLLGFALVFLIGTNWLGSYFYPGGYLFAQSSSSDSHTLLPVVFLAVVMLVGIVSSFIFERAKTPQAQRTTVSRNMKKSLTDFHLIAALFVSPMIFNSVYALVGQAPDSMSDYLLAYQNGFFWQTILSGLASKVAPSK